MRFLTVYLIWLRLPYDAKSDQLSVTYEGIVKDGPLFASAPAAPSVLPAPFWTILIRYYDQIPGIFVWQDGQVPPEVTWFSMI